MNTLILGIDPGLTGAVALIGPAGTLVEDLPVIRDGRFAWIDGSALVHLLRQWGVGDPATESIAFVERAQAMPGQGVSSSFQTGLTAGSLLAALQCAGVGIRLVQPRAWKVALGLAGDPADTDRERKQRSIDRARLRFPHLRMDRAKDHNRAEALLLAAYGQSLLAAGGC